MRVLLCTVGSSDQPVVRAIEAVQPDRVCFLCSGPDPVGRSSGSGTLVEGTGLVCGDPHKRPSRPAIPVQARLPDDRWEVLLVPTDDPGEVCRIARDWMNRGDPEREIVANYTAGTKSMSAGLYLACVLTPGVRLQLVSGPRTDLVAIQDGLETVRELVHDQGGHSFRLEMARSAWGRHAYAEAAGLLRDIGSPSAQVERVRVLSLGFAAWDSFDYRGSRQTLRALGGRAGEERLGALAVLAMDEETRRRTALQIVDLWHAAERRVAGGTFDGAVLLLYRALEWIAQWSLRWDHEIDSADVSIDEHPELSNIAGPSHTGKRVLGMFAAWQAVRCLRGPLSKCAAQVVAGARTHAELRNHSVYAHGHRPVTRDQYERFREWMQATVLLDFLGHEFRRRTPPFPQLPTVWPEDADGEDPTR